MIKTLIAGRPDFKKDRPDNPYVLEIAELFANTIQGEGINIGHPATFLRVQHCTMNCIWCDTQEVWRYGNPYTFDEIYALMEETGTVNALEQGQHLVLTGGSPLKQQKALSLFIRKFVERFEFKPYIEIENECTILPQPDFEEMVDCWNNSPKLENSGNLDIVRYQPRILKFLSNLENSWFKFVVTNDDDWAEIEVDFLATDLIKRNQIILMPQGATRTELKKNQEKVVEIAIRENVRYSSRQHIELWDKRTGV